MSTIAELQQRAEEDFPESWIPSKDSPTTLAGEVIGYTTGRSKFGEKTICIVRDADGKRWSVWLSQNALVRIFARERPQPGDLVALSYQGMKVSQKTGNDYHAFKLVMDRDDGPTVPDFDAMAADADAEGGEDNIPASDVAADTSGLVAVDDQGEEGENDAIPF